MTTHEKKSYYLPGPTFWPIIGSIALFSFFFGFAMWLQKHIIGPILLFIGFALIVFMIFGWFGTVIQESRAGLLAGKQVSWSFRWGMIWFIFTEIMFFAAFFAALFYARFVSVPILGGHGESQMTHILLWPKFHATWPLYKTPDPTQFTGPKDVMYTWGIPAINTAILLTSGVTITLAHWSVINDRRWHMKFYQILTICLGIIFVSMQAYEYLIAYNLKELKLTAGIYGTTFFMLTGFHALHVTLGAIMLMVILYRMFKGDFTPKNHFGFEAVSWYWHFVDVVWLALFIFVYWL